MFDPVSCDAPVIGGGPAGAAPGVPQPIHATDGSG
jgi:hypothetical protein